MRDDLHLIMIRGRNGVGKDTFAWHIQEICKAFKIPTKVFPFADAVRKEAAEVYNLDYDRLCTDYAYKDLHRDKQIIIGNKRREEDNLYWFKKNWESIRKWYIEQTAEYSIAIVNDCRYNNELYGGELLQRDELIRKAWPIYIYANDVAMLKRFNHDLKRFANWKLLENDVSERDVRMDNYPYYMIVDNSNDKSFLYMDAAKIISQITNIGMVELISKV